MEPIPKQTLYLKNLNDKVHPEKMKLILMSIFSSYGRIVDIICKRTLKLRGQAWVVFDKVSDATKAKEKLNKRILCTKELQIYFAKTQSDSIVRLKNPEEYKLRLNKRRDNQKKKEKQEH